MKRIKKDSSVHIQQREKINFDLTIQEFPWSERQKEFIRLAQDKNTKVIFLSGVAGTAKAQPLDALIMTPEGYVRMGDIKIGDNVISQDGNATAVLGVYPQGIKEIFEVGFSDGSSCEATGDHLWETSNVLERTRRLRVPGSNRTKRYKSPRSSIKTTLEIKNSLSFKGKINHSIPMVNPVSFTTRDFVIHPYILGVLLGDGNITNAVDFCSWDKEIVERVENLLPDDLKVKEKLRKNHFAIIKKKFDWRIKNRFETELSRLGLLGKRSEKKFIPEIYKYASIEQRTEILRGLMDADGTTSGMYTSFASTSFRLCEDVRFLVESLGGTAAISKPMQGYYYKNEIKINCLFYNNVSVKLPFNINPFYLKRKNERVIPCTKYIPRRYIVSVKSVGYKEAQCILVENPCHLYLTNNFIVTHNTLLGTYIGLQALKNKRAESILYIRQPVESSKFTLGYLKGDLNEKMAPYIAPLDDKLKELLTKPQIEKLKADERILTVPLGHLRGRTFNVTHMFVDETQNFSKEDLLLIMTRMGRFSKLILCGDYMQSDVKTNGFQEVSNLFDDEESRANGIHTFQFGYEDIFRNEILSYIIQKFGTLEV